MVKADVTKAIGPEKLQRHAGFSAALIEGKLQPARIQGITTHVHRGTNVVMQGSGAYIITVHPTLGADHWRFIRHKFFGTASQIATCWPGAAFRNGRVQIRSGAGCVRK